MCTNSIDWRVNIGYSFISGDTDYLLYAAYVSSQSKVKRTLTIDSKVHNSLITPHVIPDIFQTECNFKHIRSFSLSLSCVYVFASGLRPDKRWNSD